MSGGWRSFYCIPGHSRPTSPRGYFSGSPTPAPHTEAPTSNCTGSRGCKQSPGAFLALVVPVERHMINCPSRNPLCHIRFGRGISEPSRPTKQLLSKWPCEPQDLLCHYRYGDTNDEVAESDGRADSIRPTDCHQDNPLCHFNPGGKRSVSKLRSLVHSLGSLLAAVLVKTPSTLPPPPPPPPPQRGTSVATTNRPFATVGHVTKKSSLMSFSVP